MEGKTGFKKCGKNYVREGEGAKRAKINYVIIERFLTIAIHNQKIFMTNFWRTLSGFIQNPNLCHNRIKNIADINFINELILILLRYKLHGNRYEA